MLRKEWFRTILPFLILWGMCFPALWVAYDWKLSEPWDKLIPLFLMLLAFLLAHSSRNRWRELEAAETAAAKAEAETKAEAKAEAEAKAKAEAEAEAKAKAEAKG